jgi:ATP-dependent exoDNAse (exonuclease V) alpha subunit
MKPAFDTFFDQHREEWTPCQQSAWGTLSPLFDSDLDVQVGLLRGYAGTGKTHWVAQVVQFLEATGWEVKVLTPTGRAAQVLADRMAPYQVLATPQTIHSCIYDIQPQDFSSSQLELFAETRVMEGDQPTMVVVDEGSMVGDQKRERKPAGFNFGSGSLLHDLMESLDVASRDSVRILFVGDSAQLPPVGGSNESTPALSRKGVESVLREMGCKGALVEAELQTVVRQNEGTLKQFVTRVRKVLDSGEELPKKAVDDVQPIRSEDLMPLYLKETNQGTSPERAVILAHSNKDVYDYNRKVRDALGRNDREIMAGEVLLVKRNVTMRDFGELEISNVMASLKNGTFVEVVGEPHPRRKVEISVREDKVELRFWSARIRVLGTPAEVDVVVLANFLDPAMWSGTKEERARRYSAVESAVLIDFQQRMRKERGWSPAKPSDAHYEDYSRAAKSDAYLNALRIAYGYSVTVHNAQGGEWPVVFVDPASNKARDWQHDMKHRMSFARWVYTASTRARESLWFIKHTVVEEGA